MFLVRCYAQCYDVRIFIGRGKVPPANGERGGGGGGGGVFCIFLSYIRGVLALGTKGPGPQRCVSRLKACASDDRACGGMS
jgi:hypothetical protein